MPEHWFEQILNWLQPFLLWATMGSLLLAVVSLVLLPILIVRMPADYFLAAERKRRWNSSTRWMIVIRNILAIILLTSGILMLILPGQGLLTILAAVVVSDVPGKYRLERWLVTRPGILRAINWIRHVYKKVPVQAPRPYSSADSKPKDSL